MLNHLLHATARSSMKGSIPEQSTVAADDNANIGIDSAAEGGKAEVDQPISEDKLSQRDMLSDTETRQELSSEEMGNRKPLTAHR